MVFMKENYSGLVVPTDTLVVGRRPRGASKEMMFGAVRTGVMKAKATGARMPRHMTIDAITGDEYLTQKQGHPLLAKWSVKALAERFNEQLRAEGDDDLNEDRTVHLIGAEFEPKGDGIYQIGLMLRDADTEALEAQHDAAIETLLDVSSVTATDSLRTTWKQSTGCPWIPAVTVELAGDDPESAIKRITEVIGKEAAGLALDFHEVNASYTILDRPV